MNKNLFGLSLPFDKLRMFGNTPFALSLSKGRLSANGIGGRA
jgi:hypothetical protein